MSTLKRFRKRRNELCRPHLGTWNQDNNAPIVHDALNVAAPSWVAMYDYCQGAAEILSKRLGNLEETQLGVTIALADKFLNEDTVEVKVGSDK